VGNTAARTALSGLFFVHIPQSGYGIAWLKGLHKIGLFSWFVANLAMKIAGT
jgi:hypothetical protein